MQETGADRDILFPLGLGVINNHQAGEYQNIRISECVQFHSMNGGVSNRLGWIFSQEMNLPHISTHIHNLIIAQYFCSKLRKYEEIMLANLLRIIHSIYSVPVDLLVVGTTLDTTRATSPG